MPAKLEVKHVSHLQPDQNSNCTITGAEQLTLARGRGRVRFTVTLILFWTEPGGVGVCFFKGWVGV
jgi:hypothetical protein